MIVVFNKLKISCKGSKKRAQNQTGWHDFIYPLACYTFFGKESDLIRNISSFWSTFAATKGELT